MAPMIQMPKMRNPYKNDQTFDLSLLKDDEGNDRPIEDIQADIAAKQDQPSDDFQKLTDPYADVQSKIQDLYNQTGGLTTDIKSHLASMPHMADFQPSTGNKIGAAIAAIAQGALSGPDKGLATYNQVLQNPYTKAMNEWQQEGQGLGQLSDVYGKQLQGQERLAGTEAGLAENQANIGIRQQQQDFEKAQAAVKNTQFQQEFDQRTKQFGQENAVNWAKAHAEELSAQANMVRAQNPIGLTTPTKLGSTIDENGNQQDVMGTRRDFLDKVQQNNGAPITMTTASRQNKAAVGSANRVQTQAQYILDMLDDPNVQAEIGPVVGRINRGEIGWGNSGPTTMHLYGGIKELEAAMPEHAQKLNDAMVGMDQNPEAMKAALQEIITAQKNTKQAAGVGGNNQSIQPQTQQSLPDLIAAYKKAKGMP